MPTAPCRPSYLVVVHIGGGAQLELLGLHTAARVGGRHATQGSEKIAADQRAAAAAAAPAAQQSAEQQRQAARSSSGCSQLRAVQLQQQRRPGGRKQEAAARIKCWACALHSHGITLLLLLLLGRLDLLSNCGWAEGRREARSRSAWQQRARVDACWASLQQADECHSMLGMQNALQRTCLHNRLNTP